MEKKIFIKTFGCQMNEYDSNRIYDSVKKIGFKKTDDQTNTDCFVLNTCHIRDKAKEKVYHEIGRIKKIYRKKNKPIMVLAGCVAQAENQEMLKREPYIDIVIGPQSYHKINETLKQFISSVKKEETDFDTISKFEYFDKIENKSNKISAFLTIQEGCDKFCNFCVVPFTRGPEYSRPFNKILYEAESLIKNGAKEIILLGQNVNAYSYFENSKEYRISNLINELEKYSELKRIRYTTSHPRDMTDDLIDCYKNNKKLMPFIHLPIQSGSNKILKLMNRKHTVEEYINIYEKLKKINSEIEFSSDFIISYPGETNNDFNDTLNLVKKIKFINSYSFIFSPRPGTKAAELKLIDNETSKERLNEIQKYLFIHQIKKNRSFEGKFVEVLTENRTKDKLKLFGRNKFNNSVIFLGDENNIGKLVKVKIENTNQNSLFGKIQKNKSMKAA
jgi:tRNA-2-methylthio-N6-dimethylallyladenosine synthase